MTENKTYPEEIFEWRINRYKQKKRTKHPADEMRETAIRVNKLAYGDVLNLKFPDDFQQILGEPGSDRLPINLYDIKFEYKNILNTIKITGSGGSIMLDESVCVIDFSMQYMKFIQQESCGECTFCRIGSRRMYEILNGICNGKGELNDIDTLKSLAEDINISSLCEIGKAASNPVLCTVKNFRNDYEDHILMKKCRAGICTFN